MFLPGLLLSVLSVNAQDTNATSFDAGLLLLILSAAILIVTTLIIYIVVRIKNILKLREYDEKPVAPEHFEHYLTDLDADEIALLLKRKNEKDSPPKALIVGIMIAVATCFGTPLFAQSTNDAPASLFNQPGIIITIVLIIIPLLIAVGLMVVKANSSISKFQRKRKDEEATELADYLSHLKGADIDASLLKRKSSLEYQLSNNELSGTSDAEDDRGVILHSNKTYGSNFVPLKKRGQKRPSIDAPLAKLILWYFGCAIFWLVFGTTVGEYLGIKFVSPDVDHLSWLSFGRLRPVHTNAVFWGWSSLAMLGLGHYVVPVVSNCSLKSLRKGWAALVLINMAVGLGTICLMAGINNGGGEYREYVWPVMALFGIALIIALINFLQTISQRKTKEIYISNWYLISAIIFTIVIAIIAYWPTWQNGLGETIVQGYYMHQGVGMWFMLFTLGLVYYFLPQQLNKPIYSYSLGILAFWTQILFYTVIGTHHFVFSSIPWWLQTVAIVGSMGMLIPVLAGTTNFLLTFNGAWHKISNSYTLPFFLVGVVFYFTGSFQGTAEAFRYTNQLWHFTDFTVAHSHITMYGIIAFLLWGSIYALVPRITGREPRQVLMGVHFWLAFIGLLLYSVPLMIGGTLKGLQWMDGKPFIDGVIMMAPYWLWRAIGGSMMWLSHLFFAYNFYEMVSSRSDGDVKKLAFEKLKHEGETEVQELN